MTRSILTALLLLSLSGCASLLRSQADQGLATLMTTQEFASTHVGYAGTLSRQAEAFEHVLASSQSAVLVSDLVEHGTTAGQLYGLMGLYLTDPEAFEREVPRFAASEEYVMTQFGCIGMEERVRDLVAGTQGCGISDGCFSRSFAPTGT